MDTLKPEELKELREWAASVNLTWTQIEALNGFYKEQKEDKANGTKKVNIVSVRFEIVMDFCIVSHHILGFFFQL